MTLIHSPTDEATKILFPINILSTARTTKMPSKTALVIHTYDGLCLKLIKQTKEAVNMIVIETMALKIYNLLFSNAFSSIILSREYIRSMKTIA